MKHMQSDVINPNIHSATMAACVVANWDSLVLHEVNPTGKEIGHGAYGRVFEVNYEGKLYAAKEIHALLQCAETDELQKIKDGFLSKYHIWSTLRHPCIVPFLGVYYPTRDQYKLPVMVMEKMQQSLRNLVEKHDNIPLNVKLSILDEVCLGLRYLHSRNPPIVHGDLTPNNILLNNHLEAKITGLSVAKITGLDVAKVVKSDHNQKDFMPPESQSDRPVDTPSSDVFSYGGVILNVTTQIWPHPTDPTVFNPDTGGREVKRRQNYLDMMTGGTADLKPLVISCLDDNPMNRPTIAQVSMTIKHVKDVKHSCDECSEVSKEQESQECTVDVRIKAKETIRNHYEEKLSTKEVEINQLTETVTEHKLKMGNLETQNKQLQTQTKQLERRIKQLQKSSKEHQQLVTENEQLKLENKQLKLENKQLKELSKNGLECLANKNEELKLENEELKLENERLKELSKESSDNATKTENTTEHVASYYEEICEVEICQLNELYMQNEIDMHSKIIRQNKMLRRRIKQLRELSKKDMECQIKLENEINKLKAENEQLMKLSKESIDDVKIKAENAAEYVVRLKCDYEERLSTKEMEINNLVQKLEMSENQLITGNANLKRTTEQLQESSKLLLEKLSAKEVKVNQLNDAVRELKRELDDVKAENNMSRRRFEQLEELSKKYRDYQKKLETENERLKLEIEQLRESSEEKLSTKEVEINQLNDTVTELKIKQYDVITGNKILKRSNERLRELSKKDLENQNKLETEREKLKLEIDQLKESSKNDLKYLETEGEKLKLEIEQLRESLKKGNEYQNKLETDCEKLRLEIERLRELSKSTNEEVPTAEEDSMLAHIIPIDGPYHINCDGQSGGCFVWDDCGLEINFPPQCSQQDIQVTMSTLLPIKNEVHPTVHIVSAVYQFNCNIKRFDKAFTLRLQHCIELQSPEDCQKMRFIIQHGGNNDVKYGHFEVGNSYGTVNLHKFCRVFIVWICELWNNIRTIILPVTDDQDDNKNNNTSQGAYSNEQSSVSSGGHSEEHSAIQTDHTAPSQSASQSANGKQHDSLVPSSSSAAFYDVKRGHKESKPTSPIYKYESMIGLPRDHCYMSDWSSIYSIYVKLGGWRKVSKESMQMEEVISNFPVNFYADEIEFDVGSVAMIACEKMSEEATIIVKCRPYQIKKEDVTNIYEEYVDTCKKYPLCCRHDNILRTIIPKSFIHVTKTSDAPPSNCQLTIKGIKPHQQVDLCTSGCTNLTLVDTIDSRTKVNAGPVRSVPTSPEFQTTSTVQATTTLPTTGAGKNQKRSFNMYANIDISPCLRQSGILETKPEMKDLIIIVIPLLKAEWEDVAFILNYKTPSIDGIKESNRNDPKKCCRELFKNWLETNHGVSPKTWGTLLNTIAESGDFTKTAEDILEQLEKKFIA